MVSNDNNNNGTTPSPPTVMATSATASECPVLVRRGDAESATKKPGLWSRWVSRSDVESNSANSQPSKNNTPVSSSMSAISECPVKGNAISECPVKGNKSIPASIEEAANYSQTPFPGQRIPLSRQRVISSIPRGATDSEDTAPLSTTTENKNNLTVPAQQLADLPRWQYPSEQQFYNAMRKKGYRPPVESIPSVLQIHNAVNERSWVQLCRWEKELHGNEDPKLVKFVGRPKDLSPMAWFNSRILMTQEPFDRHDWYVEDVEGGDPRRYVIDFYEGKEKRAELGSTLASAASNGKAATNVPVMKPPSMYIDVRPALDNPSAAKDRMTMFARELLPGIAGAWDSYNTPAPPPSFSIAEMDGGDSKRGSGNH